MFEHCNSIEKLDLSPFNIENVTRMIGLFQNCFSLKEINLPKFNTNNKNIKIEDMFFGYNSLKSINKCDDPRIIKEFKKICGN